MVLFHLSFDPSFFLISEKFGFLARVGASRLRDEGKVSASKFHRMLVCREAHGTAAHSVPIWMSLNPCVNGSMESYSHSFNQR